ncbi:VOC family protein [Cellulomonas shaoxiangyii]|uniref:VOC family protein n=1 Tax=Cellulomonas shaoxiangyii TaxID=2566013 RepID=A0A4P7SH74_9CELL|nr:VOC family protein [Cellulomonas shaoxiangyii]QCB93018.1 VOC family protein [Cellulomonas shaoxiangyii]TGY85566.1 VOC family protein [Cellulomonas shaoxiangyii]
MGAVRTHLWFPEHGYQAAEFYVSVVPSSRITAVVAAPPGVPDVHEGDPFVVELELDGHAVTILTAGPAFRLDEAFSLYLVAETQEEVDHYWETLTADGGEPGRCGWLKDRFGVSWQVVPRMLDELWGRPDAAGVQRAMQLMLGMTKIEIAPLEAAYANA